MSTRREAERLEKWADGFDSMWIYAEGSPSTDMNHEVYTARWFHDQRHSPPKAA